MIKVEGCGEGEGCRVLGDVMAKGEGCRDLGDVMAKGEGCRVLGDVMTKGEGCREGSGCALSKTWRGLKNMGTG